jgi:hypothetical protein
MTASKTITVEAYKPATSLNLWKKGTDIYWYPVSSAAMDIGDSMLIWADIQPNNATNMGVNVTVTTLQGTTPAVTVTQPDSNFQMTVTAVAEGKVNITVTSKDNASLTQNIVVTVAHNWGPWTVTTPATCTTDGVETRVCSNNSAHTETRTITALGHDWGDWTVTTPATCTTAGVRTRVCKRDASHTETETIPALGHDWGDWTVTTPATCTTDGVETRVCKNDPSHIETRAIAALGHDWGDWDCDDPRDLRGHRRRDTGLQERPGAHRDEVYSD